mgnify:CR=1 FL=1
MNIEQVKALVAIAIDENESASKRLTAFHDADSGRKELKIGWSKLGLNVEQVEDLKSTLPALAEREEQEDAHENSDPPGPETAPADEPEGTSSEAPGDTTTETNEASGGSAENTPTDDQAQERAAAKVRKAKEAGTGEVRGGLTRLVESLLMDPALSYLDIIHAVLKDFPKANTSARSIASVAAGLRRKGQNVPMRRPAKAEKPAPEAAAAA